MASGVCTICKHHRPGAQLVPAELEIRLLSERIDALLTHQWQRLLEIQQIQIELMQELNTRGSRGGRDGEP
jgi:hypothetical protein